MMGTPAEPRLDNRTGLLILALAIFAVVTTEMPVGLLPAISTTFGIGESTTGLLVSLYAVVVALVAVPLTLVTRAVDRKRLLLIAVACLAASNVIAAAAPKFAALAAARALGAATHALFYSVCIGYGHASFRRNRLARRSRWFPREPRPGSWWACRSRQHSETPSAGASHSSYSRR
jgi:predicted MFS family arabinose efflux permease